MATKKSKKSLQSERSQRAAEMQAQARRSERRRSGLIIGGTALVGSNEQEISVVDLATGDEASPRSLSFSSTELRTLAFENRLILLEPQPGAMQTLLHPSLKMSDLQLFRPDPVEPESYVLGGRIRFPLGERETVEVAPGALLSLDAREPLTLTSCSLTSGRLEIAVRGKVAHLAMGPTADLHTELLPNLFRWLYTHELRKLIYGILASVLGTSLALLKLFGGFKE